MAERLVQLGTFRRVVATDIVSYDSAPAGVSSVLADLNEPTPIDDRSIDLIVAVEVVEHLENIRAACREFARLLRPRGSIVLTTPNNESLRAIGSLALRGHFSAFTDSSYPAHITALVRVDIQRALSEAGLVVKRFFYTDQGSIPWIPRVSWQAVSLGALRGRWFSDNVGCVASKP
jgi:2-polyprenyl-3-methyl-5-hydroxy-6-metoxy-1,4-benzoquinol methylase